MKKRIFLSSMLMLGILLLGMRTASAIALEINPSTFDTTGLATVDVTFSITGLDAANEIVSGYDFDVLYDETLLSVDNVALKFIAHFFFVAFPYSVSILLYSFFHNDYFIIKSRK